MCTQHPFHPSVNPQVDESVYSGGMAQYTSPENEPVDIEPSTVQLIQALDVATGRGTADLFRTAADLLREQLVPSTRKPVVKATKGRKTQ